MGNLFVNRGLIEKLVPVKKDGKEVARVLTFEIPDSWKDGDCVNLIWEVGPKIVLNLALRQYRTDCANRKRSKDQIAALLKELRDAIKKGDVSEIAILKKRMEELTQTGDQTGDQTEIN